MSGEFSRRTFVRNAAIGASAVVVTGSVARGFPANEKVQLGWIGVGGRGSGLLDDMVKHCPDARIVAVCDLKPERIEVGKKTAERDKPNGYTDFRQMMEKEKLDGILIFTEPFNHAPVVVPVLDAGYHCFAEKPMDTAMERVDAIVKAARKAKGLYQIGTQRRYHPSYVAGMKMLHEGRLGKVTFMQGHWHWSWRGTGTVARDGGFFTEQASHHTDIMAWAMGEQHPVKCVSIAYMQEPKPEGPNVWNETHSATAFQFPNGEIFSYTHLKYLAGRFTDEKTWIFCEKGCLDPGHGKMYLIDGNKEEQYGLDSKGDWGLGTTEELQDFVDNIKTGGKRKPNANVETGRVATMMCLMARKAHVNPEKNAFEPRVVEWKDLGSSTDA